MDDSIHPANALYVYTIVISIHFAFLRNPEALLRAVLLLELRIIRIFSKERLEGGRKVGGYALQRLCWSIREPWIGRLESVGDEVVKVIGRMPLATSLV